MASPLFSTIIPAFNRRSTIGRTLESVLGQRLAGQEIIVVDDGSTDGTPDLVSSFGPAVKLLRQTNRGPGAARNLGIAQASGRYITFVDSDDLWFPWTLETYRRAISQFNQPAFIGGTEICFHDEAELKRVVEDEFDAEWFADYYAAANSRRTLRKNGEPLTIAGCGAAIRADVLRAAGGFTDRWINAEDCDLWMKLGAAEAAEGFVQLRSPMALAYRLHAGTAVANLTRTFQGVCHMIEQEKSGQYPGGPSRRAERWRVLTRHTRAHSITLCRAGRAAEGWSIYRQTRIWNLRELRLRYLLGLPILAVKGYFRGAGAGHAGAANG
jgi:hypothetical protein